MAINPVSRGMNAPVTGANDARRSILDQIDSLVKNKNIKIINDAICLADDLVKLSEENLSLAREGLCRLLSLNSEEVRLEVIRRLKPLLHIGHLAYDVKNNQSQQLIGLEKQMSEILALNFRLFSSELLFALVDLYQDVLEHLWLLPYLCEDISSYALIVEENGQRMVRDGDRWLFSLLNDNAQPKRLQIALKSLPRIFRQIINCPSTIINEIKELKTNLHSPYILGLVGAICHKIGDNQRAIDHYLENLLTLTSLREKLGEDIGDDLEKYLLHGVCVVMNHLGISYESLGEYRKAIKFQEECLKIALAIGDRNEEGAACRELGSTYQSLGEYRKAIEFHEKQLKIAQEQGDKHGEGTAYRGLGGAYDSLGEYRKAIEYHEKQLKIAQKDNDRRGKGEAYGNLGNVYDSLGEYREAIEYHEKALQIAREIDDQRGKGAAYGNLGNAYLSLGEYRKAIECQEKHLQIAQEIGDRAGEGTAYGNLGNTYCALGKYRKAIECQEKHLQIAQEIGDRAGEGTAYGNLGNVYSSLGDDRRAIEYHEKSLQIALETGNRGLEEVAYLELGASCLALGDCYTAVVFYEKQSNLSVELGNMGGGAIAYRNLGNVYEILEESDKAIEFLEKALFIAQGIGYRSMEGIIYGDLGTLYQSLGKYCKAIEFLEKTLRIAQEIGDQDGEGAAFNNLGVTYEMMNNLPQAEKCFNSSITVFSSLEHETGDSHQWKITIFEKQSKAYLGLERVLFKQGKNKEALEVTDGRRSRALVAILSKKLNLETQTLPLVSMKIPEMQALAKKLRTLFLIYSISPLTEEQESLSVWLIHPDGTPIAIRVPMNVLPEELRKASKIFKRAPFISAPPAPRQPRKSLFKGSPLAANPPGSSGQMQQILSGPSLDAESLSQWYKALISPLEPSIKEFFLKDPEQTLTIIPDNFLSQVPFAAFLDENGKYLIEKYPISFAPSVKVLQLLDQIPGEISPKSLVIANPTTPNPSDQLLPTEQEAEMISNNLLNKTSTETVLMHSEPTVGRVLKELPQSRWIHLACHGLIDEKPEEKLDPHSVFEGFFKLASDEAHAKGLLYAQEIASVSLHAELVFMSSCFSGRGKIQREGSIGPIWSFLAAGARSAVGSYWRLPANEIMNEAIKTFYMHYLGIGVKKLNKAQALQQAILFALNKDRNNLQQWAALFLSGLPNDLGALISLNPEQKKSI